MYGLPIIVLFVLNSALGDKPEDPASQISHDILDDYNADVIPSGLDGGPLLVNHSLYVMHIDSLKDSVLTLNGWLDTVWHDPRLEWDPEKYLGVSKVVIPVKRLWKPDFILMNSASEFTGNHYEDLNAAVLSDGTVHFDPPFYSKSICPFDEAELFTHNTVVCGLRFLSWTYDGKQLDINLVDNGVNSNYLEPRPNQKWSYVESSSERTVKYYDCCPEPYISVQYDITLQRVA